MRKHKPNSPACDKCGSELPNDIWKDPSVQAALKSGRPAYDIMCLRCPRCDRLGYYNQGSYFTCRFCDESYYVLCEDEAPPEGRKCMWTDDLVSLSDTITLTTDGYHNHTP